MKITVNLDEVNRRANLIVDEPMYFPKNMDKSIYELLGDKCTENIQYRKICNQSQAALEHLLNEMLQRLRHEGFLLLQSEVFDESQFDKLDNTPREII